MVIKRKKWAALSGNSLDREFSPLTELNSARRLRVEQLEDRRMLAVFMVSSLNESGGGSLRDAIVQANSAFGPDEIQFAVTGNIALTSGQMDVTETLTITGPGQDDLTIDAQNKMRIFYSSTPGVDFTISGMTLTGGRTTADGGLGRGGAIRIRDAGTLTIEDSTITVNSTKGAGADGGAIQAGGNVVLARTKLTDNFTSGSFADGGGLFAYGKVTIKESTVSGNSTTVAGADGGAIYSQSDVDVIDSFVIGNHSDFGRGGSVHAAGTVSVNNSTISGNFTGGDNGPGGGIAASGDINVVGSTISGNYTSGQYSHGGGMYSIGNITITQSTISDNHTESDLTHGGGVFVVNDLDLIASTASGNYTLGDGSRGGGLYANDYATIDQSLVAGNYTIGEDSYGGGVFAEEDVTVTLSTISGNHTEGTHAHGGGINVNGAAVMIEQSTIQGNFTKGLAAIGGAIRTTTAIIAESTIAENWTEGSNSDGGAVFANGFLVFNNSTASGNWTEGLDAKGGALFGSGGFSLNQSTVSGNHTEGDFARGGGIFSIGITALRSTVTDNHTLHPNVYGGGIANHANNVVINGSIIAGNTSLGTSPDVAPGTAIPFVNYSLIGDTTGSGISAASGSGNILNQSAMLGPLTDIGGSTETHGPLPGSPVIDMGDPTPSSPPTFDQRGTPFDRIVGLQIDIGAVEDQAIPASADFDNDNDVDGRDFLLWQRGYGTPMPNAVKRDGDADSDYDVDNDDLAVWAATFGQAPPLVAGAPSVASKQPSTSSIASITVEPSPLGATAAVLIDAAMILDVQPAAADEDESPAADRDISYETAFVTIGIDERRAPKRSAGVTAAAESLISHSEPAVDDTDRWPGNELLERVFG